MSSLTELYGQAFGARYLQCLESFSLNSHRNHFFRPGIEHANLLELQMERLVKLHALFGCRIVIPSIAPIQSTVLLHLFQNEQFSQFLAKFPQFLELKCNFNRDIDETNQHEIVTQNRVLSGLRRTQDAAWTSSLFHDVERKIQTDAVKRVAGAIIDQVERRGQGFDLRDVQQAVQGSVSNLERCHSQVLCAVPNVIYHFLSQPAAPVSRTTLGPRNIYEVVTDVRNELAFEEHTDNISNLISFMENKCSKDFSFSNVITNAEQFVKNERERWVLLDTACYAYNFNLVEQIAPRFASYLEIPDAAPIGLHSGTISNVVVHKQSGASVKKWPLRVAEWAQFNFDLDKISWKDIESVMSTDAVLETASEFQRWLHHPYAGAESIERALQKHSGSLGAELREKEYTKPSGESSKSWYWMFGGAGFSGAYYAVCLAIGGTPEFQGASASFSAGAGAADVALNKLRQYVAAETIREHAIDILHS